MEKEVNETDTGFAPVDLSLEERDDLSQTPVRELPEGWWPGAESAGEGINTSA